jgi:hypothetical protein
MEEGKILVGGGKNNSDIKQEKFCTKSKQGLSVLSTLSAPGAFFLVINSNI